MNASQMTPCAPLTNAGHRGRAYTVPLTGRTMAVGAGDNLANVVGSKFGKVVTLTRNAAPVLKVVGPILALCRPSQIACAVVRLNAVGVGNYVRGAWAWAVKGFADKRMNVFLTVNAARPEINNLIPDRTRLHALDAAGKGSALLRGCGAPDAAKVADLISPSRNRTPFFSFFAHYARLLMMKLSPDYKGFSLFSQAEERYA